MQSNKSELRQFFYAKLQAQYDQMRSRGIDKAIILEILSEHYGITKTSLRNKLRFHNVEVPAYDSARETFKTILQ
jgi:hypothetical protein